MQCFFPGLKICGSKINTTMFAKKYLFFTLATGMIFKSCNEQLCSQQLQSSSSLLTLS